MLTLKQFRNKYKITQKDLAAKVGVTPTTLSKYERGEWMINQAVIDRIKAEYGEDIRPLARRNSRQKIWMKKD
jgi:transcriptional regulator with XRE-family HTH domain